MIAREAEPTTHWVGSLLMRLFYCLLLLLPGAVLAQQRAMSARPVSQSAPAHALLATFAEFKGGEARYHTVLFAPADSGRYQAVGGRGAWTLRDSSAWRVAERSSTYNRWNERFLYASKPEIPADLRGIDVYNGEYCEGTRTQTLRFLSPRFIGYETVSQGACEGAAHPWQLRALAVAPFDSLDHPGLDLTVLAGLEAEDLERAAARNLAQLDASTAARWLDVPDAANWLPVRREGTWKIQLRLDAIDLASQGQVRDFTTDLLLPDTLFARVGADDLRRALRQVNGARDAFLSPDGAVGAVRRPGLMTMHRVDRRRYGRALVGFPVALDADLIQLRWLTRSEARKMERALRRAG